MQAVVLPLFDPEAAPSEVHLRRATINDLDALIMLEHSAFTHDRISPRQWRHHLESLSAEIFVAIRERQLVGAVVVFYRRNAKVSRLYSIAVAASERGNRIGQLLLGATEQAARLRGCRAQRLEVRVDNAAAQRLYDRLGYRRIGTRKAYYEDGADAVRYEKALPPPVTASVHALRSP